ncbi:MAG: hypothetical protein RMZ41_026440 [Nostoc sp. DedVER02]|uniref:hypothetical protein n=1 Tax=unclassified Nostoc TaxID=2593658 RepID=UPI002AD54D77|nr:MULTISPECIES: hypothetical protein [unclassified Nostoc]MDZ7987774.1 hypothetical protein [Nostoc sp. DedVER02]MDZ8110856.1 hypothetical protein [Nostoc sp. DedVER01b]
MASEKWGEFILEKWLGLHSNKDAINRRLYKGLILVETAIYRVSYLNQTVLTSHP